MIGFDEYVQEFLKSSRASELVGRSIVNLGNMDDFILRPIIREYERLVPTKLSIDDCDADFEANKIDLETVRKLNDEHQYFEISGHLRFLIWKFVRSLAISEPRILWDILNIRAWKTDPSNHSEFGPTDWHFDGMPRSINKIMIYLTEIGGERGGLQFIADGNNKIISDVCGPPGIFILFNNSTIRHRAVAPSVGYPARKCIEITLVPLSDAQKEQPFPKLGGLNARHPVAPYYGTIWR